MALPAGSQHTVRPPQRLSIGVIVCLVLAPPAAFADGPSAAAAEPRPPVFALSHREPNSAPAFANESSLRRLPPLAETIGFPTESGRGETLNEAWAFAEAADTQLQAARLMVLAHAESRRAAQALRSPHVSIGSSYNVRTDEQSVVIPSPAPLASPTTFPFVQDEGAALGGLVNVPLYTSGRIASAIDAAQCAEASAEEVVQSIHLDLKLAVAASFLAVLESKQMLHTAEKSLQSLKTHLANVEQLHGSDVAPLTDLLDARAAVANARQRHLSAGNELLLAEAEYNRRVGRPLTSPVILQEPSIENVSGDLQSLLDAARGKRSELARIDFEAEALRNKAESIEAINRPHVFLGGTYWFEENRYRTPEGIGTLGVTALWNIYDGRHNAYQGAAYLQEAAALKCRRSGLSQEIELEIHRAWLKRAEHLQLIEETAEAVRLAEENANNVQQRYRVGMATNAEVLAAETTRIQSLERLHRARYGAILAELKLRRAAGIL